MILSILRCIYFDVFTIIQFDDQHLGTETLSWICVLGAAPFAALGFIRYNGMNAEQFVCAWIKSEILMPKKLMFTPKNVYYEALKPLIEKNEREVLQDYD